MRMKHLTLICVTAVLSSTIALQAAVPMGYPGGRLARGQWDLGVELSQGEADWTAQGQCVETVVGIGSDAYSQDMKIEGLKTQAIFGQIAYGITDDWDVFCRLGGVQAKTDVLIPGGSLSSGNAGRTRLDSDGFAGGIGARATLYRRDALSLGGLLQGTWVEPDESRFTYRYPGSSRETLETSARLRYLQIQLNVAALYQAEPWTLWMGPFLQYTQGDLDLESRHYFNNALAGSTTCAADLDDKTRLGLCLGGVLRVKQLTCQLEGQFTDQSWVWSVGMMVPVE